jgi:hypothetical protein
VGNVGRGGPHTLAEASCRPPFSGTIGNGVTTTIWENEKNTVRRSRSVENTGMVLGRKR